MIVSVATDIHYISQSLTDNGPAFEQLLSSSDGKVTLYCDPLLRAFADEITRDEPDYLLITGDLTFNGELQSHKDLAEIFHQIEEESDTQVLVFPGNHDLNYSMAREFKGEELYYTPTCSASQFAEIYGDFGYTDALMRDPSSLSYVYELDEETWLLCVDANSEASPGRLTADELTWAEDVLKTAQSKGVQVISASHQNLIAHNPIFVDGYVMGGASDLRALYEKYGVELNLSGHMHMQHIATYTSTTNETPKSIESPTNHDSASSGEIAGSITDIAGSALSVAPCQYGQLTIEHVPVNSPDDTASGDDGTASGDNDTAYDEDQAMSKERPLTITYSTRSVDVSSWAAAQGHTDPNLLDFETYAAEYFAQMGSSKTRESLAELGLPSETVSKMIDDTNRLNAAYFSGRMDTITDFESILDEWQTNAGASFFYIYLLSLKDETFADMTRWELTTGF